MRGRRRYSRGNGPPAACWTWRACMGFKQKPFQPVPSRCGVRLSACHDERFVRSDVRWRRHVARGSSLVNGTRDPCCMFRHKPAASCVEPCSRWLAHSPSHGSRRFAEIWRLRARAANLSPPRNLYVGQPFGGAHSRFPGSPLSDHRSSTDADCPASYSSSRTTSRCIRLRSFT